MANIATHFMSLELHRKQNETKILLEKKATKRKKRKLQTTIPQAE